MISLRLTKLPIRLKKEMSIPTSGTISDPRLLQPLDKNMSNYKNHRKNEWKKRELLKYNHNDTVILFSGKRLNFPNLGSNFWKEGNLYADILEAASESYGKFVFSEMVKIFKYKFMLFFILLYSLY